MKHADPHLLTPLYLKLQEDMPWPEHESTFYLLTRDGMFICRNHALFRSCVRTQRCPSELASHRSFLRLNYPKLPRRLLEQVVGFFDIIGRRHNSEAGVLLLWNSIDESIELLVPKQIGLVGTSYSGGTYPLELEYEVPELPPNRLLIGDIHSHVNYAAYSSSTDRDDEKHRPGLHLVVGRIHEEPPEFHCEVLADGMRFRVPDLGLVLEGYHARRPDEVPVDWIKQVTIEKNKPYSLAGDNASYGYTWPQRDEVVDAEALPEGSNKAKARPQTGIPDNTNSPRDTIRQPPKDNRNHVNTGNGGGTR